MTKQVIDDAVLHGEVEEDKFFVRCISQTGSKEERKWHSFEKDTQLPSFRPLIEKQILKFCVKNFRNLSVFKDKLALSAMTRRDLRSKEFC